MLYIFDILTLKYATLYIANVEKIRSAHGAVKYATGFGSTKNTPDDYYRSENIGHDGRWHDPSGMLKEFGIDHHGPIIPEHLLSLLEGKNPITNESLFEKEKEKHMAGTEIEISVPKEVSAIWAVAPDDLKNSIDQAIQEANEDALHFVQNYASFTRYGKGGKDHIRSAFVAATFGHGSSRGAMNELGGDPHRHNHNLTMNLTKCPDGKWRTLENAYMHEYQKAIGSQFRASLASKLQRLGFEIERKSDGTFTVPGVPKDLVKFWSSRSEQMKDKAEETGVSLTDRVEMQRIRKSTRRAKIISGIQDLMSRWKGEGKSHNFDEQKVIDLTKKEKEILDKEAKLKLIDQQSKLALSELVETESVFTEAELIAKMGEMLTGILDHESVLKEVTKVISDNKEVIHLDQLGDDPTRKVYMSTKEQIAIEKEIPFLTKDLAFNDTHHIEKEIIDAAIAKKSGITEEQELAVRYALSKGSLKVIVGDAGTGKTFSSAAIDDGLKLAGYTNHVIAPTWKSAKGVGQELNVEEQARAIAGFINEVNKGKLQLGSKDAILIDEAGMIGTRTMHSLLKISERTGAKIVLMGDHKQLNAIEAGSSMKIILEYGDSKRISTIRRQNDEWAREMVTNLANGHVNKGLQALYDHGGIKFEDNGKKVLQSMIADWKKSTAELGWSPATALDSDKSHLILAVKNEDVLKLNEMVREVLRERNQLIGDDVKINCQPVNAKEDDPIEMKFAIGDYIVLRKNEKDKDVEDGQEKVINRDEGLITNIEVSQNGGFDITLRMANGKMKTVNTDKYVDEKTKAFAATHSYALTMYASQGMTVRRAFVYAEGMSQRYSYVGLSRHKEAVTLYANNDSLRKKVADREDIKIKNVTPEMIKSQLFRQLSRKTEKLCTLDFKVSKINQNDVMKNDVLSVDKSVKKLASSITSLANSMTSFNKILQNVIKKVIENAKEKREEKEKMEQNNRARIR